ncbi:dihydropteroate synthase [Demequina globuliformis]|uniref:dihydropteroate synthase n=1 Tax=Demequina globuliformis TaxID=676202 RepID=UPI000AFD2188|nr:dihydropteroate synthase [Demequina globuliformis]
MTLVMGILNVTPDSFSDGGRWNTTDAAVAQGLDLARDGARVIDVGGESTRPGADRVSIEEEQARVLPVVAALAQEGLAVSVDTMRAETAKAAVEAGAAIVNDVSGGLADPLMPHVVADLDCDYVAMHWRAHSTRMDALDRYHDVVAEVRDELASRVDVLQAAGVSTERIILDPGLGFSKVAESNWPLLADIAGWAGDARVLIGASRKRFLAAAIQPDEIERFGEDLPAPPPAPLEREHATTAITTLCARAGVWGVRVHNARAAHDAIAVVSTWQNAAKAQDSGA